MTKLVDTATTLLDLGILKNHISIVDIGCGDGNWALDFLERGLLVDYLGLDCKIGCEIRFNHQIKNPRFKFKLVDAQNMLYNPTGRQLSRNLKLPVADSYADLIICHSLFTHLGKFANAQNYMAEIRRILKPGGNLWITFFQSPPNEPNYKSARTVYTEAEIFELTKGFHLLYNQGGNTTDYNDQLMLALNK